MPGGESSKLTSRTSTRRAQGDLVKILVTSFSLQSTNFFFSQKSAAHSAAEVRRKALNRIPAKPFFIGCLDPQARLGRNTSLLGLKIPPQKHGVQKVGRGRHCDLKVQFSLVDHILELELPLGLQRSDLCYKLHLLVLKRNKLSSLPLAQKHKVNVSCGQSGDHASKEHVVRNLDLLLVLRKRSAVASRALTFPRQRGATDMVKPAYRPTEKPPMRDHFR